MGSLSEFSLPVRLFLKGYRWRRIDPVPWADLPRPVTRCRVALITTAALVPPGGEPFDGSVLGGDVSYRVIAGDADVATLQESHPSNSFDHGPLRQDANLGLPLDRLRELAADGVVGSVAPRHLSFQGSITAPGRLMKRTAPEAARLLVADAVDVALLVPV